MSKNEQAKPDKGGFRLKYVLYSLIPVLALLILAELVSSVIFYQMRGKNPLAIMSVMEYVGRKVRGDESKQAPASRFIRLPENPKAFVAEMVPPDEFLAWCDNLEQKTFTVRTDESAFIMPSTIHQTPDLVVAFMGGSTTECRFNEEDVRFPYKAGRLIEEKTGKKINSYNNGISSITSMSSLNIFINKVLPLEPDYAVLMHNINDMNILMYEGTYWNDHPIRSLIVDPNNPRFSDPKYSLDEWADHRGRPIMIDTAKILGNFEKSLTTFIGVARVWGVQPVLMTQANRFTEEPNMKIMGYVVNEWKKNGISYAQVKNLYDLMNERIRATAAKNKVPLIDLAMEVPQTLEYMYDPVHFTDKGCLLVADIIAHAFTEKIMTGSISQAVEE